MADHAPFAAAQGTDAHPSDIASLLNESEANDEDDGPWPLEDEQDGPGTPQPAMDLSTSREEQAAAPRDARQTVGASSLSSPSLANVYLPLRPAAAHHLLRSPGSAFSPISPDMVLANSVTLQAAGLCVVRRNPLPPFVVAGPPPPPPTLPFKYRPPEPQQFLAPAFTPTSAHRPLPPALVSSVPPPLEGSSAPASASMSSGPAAPPEDTSASNSSADDSPAPAPAVARFSWKNDGLHDKFAAARAHLIQEGIKASPGRIFKRMLANGLPPGTVTIVQVRAHHQKQVEKERRHAAGVWRKKKRPRSNFDSGWVRLNHNWPPPTDAHPTPTDGPRESSVSGPGARDAHTSPSSSAAKDKLPYAGAGLQRPTAPASESRPPFRGAGAPDSHAAHESRPLHQGAGAHPSYAPFHRPDGASKSEPAAPPRGPDASGRQMAPLSPRNSSDHPLRYFGYPAASSGNGHSAGREWLPRDSSEPDRARPDEPSGPLAGALASPRFIPNPTSATGRAPSDPNPHPTSRPDLNVPATRHDEDGAR
eukprot:TRINITY_DN602_c1_g2_i1.p2 TRINITY_DN602_c1_g2~~TRINITY_DN602_c1_g2_i1.p2  ORF type:complete len:535 (+),score=129.49 TRINITY_DN602_c1_g2_i1:195-1799(+)